MSKSSAREQGRLTAWPGTPEEPIEPGVHALGLDSRRDAILYIPAGYQPEVAAPFVLSLHGAGGSARSGLFPLAELADDAGVILLAPSSRGQTWDMLLGGFGPDIAFLNRALAVAFAHCLVDPNHIAVSGFSDGASYALALGIMNGDLFPNVMAFSPGYAAPRGERGEPRFFISHGTRDEVLRIDATSWRIVPLLREAGYDVTFAEFDGGHTVPPAIAREALSWFLR